MKYGELTLGQIEAVVNKLGGMDGINSLLRGELEVHEVEHLIDLDAPPLIIPENGWQVEEHRKGGQLKWNPELIRLHLSPSQRNGQTIEGHQLRKELMTLAPYNANLLDYLLDRPHLIPDSWKEDEQGNTRHIYFWGTIYRGGADGILYVRYLYWGEGHRRAGYDWLGAHWGAQRPAAVPAS